MTSCSDSPKNGHKASITHLDDEPVRFVKSDGVRWWHADDCAKVLGFPPKRLLKYLADSHHQKSLVLTARGPQLKVLVNDRGLGTLVAVAHQRVSAQLHEWAVSELLGPASGAVQIAEVEVEVEVEAPDVARAPTAPIASAGPGAGLQVFAFDGAEVRVVLEGGEPHWVVADVARILEIAEAKDAVAGLDDDERGRATIPTLGGPQRMLVVTEPGLYRLLAKSRKPQARVFQRWLFHDVLPAIRRTGSYAVAPAESDLETMLERDPLLVVEALARRLRQEREERAGVEAKVAELDGPARAWAAMEDTTRDYSASEASKILSRDPAIDPVGPRQLLELLQGELDMVFVTKEKRGNLYTPRQEHVAAGRLSLLARSYYNTEGELKAAIPQLRITAKGLAYIHKKLGGTGGLAVDAPSDPAD